MNAVEIELEEILDAFTQGRLVPDMAVLAQLAPAERREVEAVLAEIRRRTELNPLWGYRPHDKQRIYHSMTCFLGGFLGGNRSGKSFGGTGDDLIELCDRDSLPPHLRQYKTWDECHLRVVVPGLETSAAFKNTVDQFRRLVPKDQLFKGDWDKAYNKREHVLQMENGNTLDILSHDQSLDRFAAVTRHRVRFDEEPPGEKGKAIFNESIARTAEVDGGQIRFTMTPLLGLSWTYHELLNDGQPRWDDECQVVRASIWDNPANSPEQIEKILGKYSETERQARELGQFVHLAGLVYPQWSRDVHVIEDGPIPRDRDGQPLWEIYEGIDPGYDHPMGFVVVAVDAYGHERVIAAWKMRHEIVGDCAARIKRTRAELGYQPQRPAIIDPSARNKNHATGRSIQMEYTDEGITTKPGHNSRSAGINRVATALERTRRGEPGLLVMATAAEGGYPGSPDPDGGGIQGEFETHRWKAKKGEEESREEVIKVNDDILDPLRYVLMERPLKAKKEKAEELLSAAERAFKASLERIRHRGRRPRASNWGAPTLR
jgi:phage terminase large subunit-like protein